MFISFLRRSDTISRATDASRLAFDIQREATRINNKRVLSDPEGEEGEKGATRIHFEC